MVTGLLLTMVAVLRWFPETATARWLERQVAETSARLAAIERRHLVFLVLMTVVLVAGAELLAIGGPLDAGLVLLWDVATYLDIVFVTASVAAVARGRSAWRIVATRWLPRIRPRRRARRTAAKARPDRRSANNDERARPLAA